MGRCKPHLACDPRHVDYRAAATDTLPITPVSLSGPPRTGSWHDVAQRDEIRPNRARGVIVAGHELVICREVDPQGDEHFHALAGRCPHQDAPLGDGEIADGMLLCPLHDCDYELRSGVSLTNPLKRLQQHPVRIDGTVIRVWLDKPGPGVPDTYQGRYLRRRHLEPDMAYVHEAARGGQAPPLTPTLAPAGLSNTPLAPHEQVDTTTTIGSRTSRPLTLALPVLIGHVSWGRVSIETKVALARGARIAGTAIGSGDGGAHGREQDAGSGYIIQTLPGARPEPDDLTDAHAIEIRIAEAATMAAPAQLPPHAVTTEIGLHRDLLPNTAWHGPSYQGPGQLTDDIAALRVARPGVPIGVKVATANIERDCETALIAGADYLSLDLLPGQQTDGTIQRAATTLAGTRCELIVGGGYHQPEQIAVALASGATAVAVVAAALQAVGCQNYRGCNSGRCPMGIATQDPALRVRLNPDISAQRVATYLDQLRSGLEKMCRTAGVPATRHLTPEQLLRG